MNDAMIEKLNNVEKARAKVHEALVELGEVCDHKDSDGESQVFCDFGGTYCRYCGKNMEG